VEAGQRQGRVEINANAAQIPPKSVTKRRKKQPYLEQ
jgi:hypothetical protein